MDAEVRACPNCFGLIYEDKIHVCGHDEETVRPKHYHEKGIDPIGYAEQKFSKEELRGFYRINVIKYVSRFELKGGKEDLKKARFYVDKLIELEE